MGLGEALHARTAACGVRAQDAHSDVSVETASMPLSSDLVFLLFGLQSIGLQRVGHD